MRSTALTSTVAVSSISTSRERAVGDAVGEQALDRVDVALARVHLVVRLVEEPPVGLLVERGEEVEVILGHLAHRDEHRLEPLGPGALPVTDGQSAARNASS